MKTSTKSILASIAIALAGGASLIGFSGEPIELEFGYALSNAGGPEDDIQKTIIAPDGSKFTIAQNYLAILALEKSGLSEQEITTQKNILLLNILSAAAELDLDISENPYL